MRSVPSLAHFFKYVVNIFQYALDFNSPLQTNEYVVMLVKRLGRCV